MPIAEHPMQALANFLPEGSFEPIVYYIDNYKVHLTVTRKRRSILGDYRHAAIGKNHRISINGNLNKFEFLITLLHEFAHLFTFEKFGNRVDAHGKEWKFIYSKLLIEFVNKKLFPQDIEDALQKSIQNPAATANGETELIRVLRKYDNDRKPGHYFVDELPVDALFATEKGKIFKKGLKRRKRIECVEVATGHRYTFSPLSEVKLLNI